MKCEVGYRCKGSIHAHHDDYAKPLEVRLLCRRHHNEWHREHGSGLNPHLAKSGRQTFAQTRKCPKVSLPDDLYAWVEEMAEREERSISEVIRLAVCAMRDREIEMTEVRP